MGNMRICTCNLPVIFLQEIEKMIADGLIPSRSEAIREAVRDYIWKQNQMLEAFHSIDTPVPPLKTIEMNGHVYIIPEAPLK